MKQQPSYDGYEAHNFTTAAEALAEVRRQHEAGEPIEWTGPDRLHHSIAAGCPPPSELFSGESLRHAEEDQGQSFWDVYTMVAFQLGFHNGVVRTGADREKYGEQGAALLAALEALSEKP